jgi:hypothetical protein
MLKQVRHRCAPPGRQGGPRGQCKGWSGRGAQVTMRGKGIQGQPGPGGRGEWSRTDSTGKQEKSAQHMAPEAHRRAARFGAQGGAAQPYPEES